MITATEMREAADQLELLELASQETARLEREASLLAVQESKRHEWWRQHEAQFAVVKVPVSEISPEWLSLLRGFACPWDSLPLGLPGGVLDNVAYPTSTLFLTCKLGHNLVARWSEKGYQVERVVLE